MKRTTKVIGACATIGMLLTSCGTQGASDKPSPAEQPSTGALTASRNAPIPEFTHSTEITNPYFPLTELGGYLLTGQEDGKPYEAKVVVTEETKSIERAGGSTETLVARHESYLEGELIEVAIDYYAQGDDGSVWYFGEDVTYYENGQVTNHEGSWLTGQDGALPGLLIPADPEVGQVFWSEDVAAQGIEERNEVVDVTATVDTPAGPRTDGLLIRALQDDGTKEKKIYVPTLGVVLEVGSTSALRLTSRDTLRESS